MGSIPKPPGPPPSPPPRPKPPMPLPPAPSMQKCMASLPTPADPYKAEAEDPPLSAPNRTSSCLLHHHHQTAVRDSLEFPPALGPAWYGLLAPSVAQSSFSCSD